MYFNKKQNRSGSLFEGRFKAKHSNTDEYLKYLFAYIHLNPVKLIDVTWRDSGISDFEKSKKYLSGYAHSSYLDYIGVPRIEGKIINKTDFPDYFGGYKEFGVLIDTWLEYKYIYREGPPFSE